MMNRLNIVLAALLVLVVTLTVVMRPDPTRPNIEFLPDMKYSPAPLAYAPSDLFANGRTLQGPLPGTIARGAMPLHFAATKEDAVRAGEELKNPYHEALRAETELAAIDVSTDELEDATAVETEPTATEQLQVSVERGAEAYRVYCVTCHGATGEGDGPVPKRGFPPPPSLLTGNSRMMKDGQLFHILTYGQGSMPRFAAELSPEARWDMANYIRDMQPPIDELAPVIETSIEATSEPSVKAGSEADAAEEDVTEEEITEEGVTKEDVTEETAVAEDTE